MSQFLKKSYWALVKSEHFIGHIFLFIIRMYWGVLLVLEGVAKLGNSAAVEQYFQTLEIPYPLVTTYVVGIMEFLGGLSLFAGFFTRFTTIPLAAIFIATYLIAHPEAIENLLTNPSLFVMQPTFLFLYVTLTILAFGPGMLSADYWLERRSYNKNLTF